MRPLTYWNNQGQVLGHYAACQLSGAIAATPTALDPHASFRWAPTGNLSALAVLTRIKVGWQCISAVTASVRISYQATIARGFSVDYVTGSTAASLAGVTKTNAMYSARMQQSLMGTSNLRITTTGAMSGHTNVLDAFPFAIQSMSSVNSVPLTGAVNNTGIFAGTASGMIPLYEWTGLGQHPVVLGNNEGVVIQLTHTGWATGTVSLAVQWEWAEVFVF